MTAAVPSFPFTESTTKTFPILGKAADDRVVLNAVFVTPETLPCASVVITGIEVDEPYTPDVPTFGIEIVLFAERSPPPESPVPADTVVVLSALFPK